MPTSNTSNTLPPAPDTLADVAPFLDLPETHPALFRAKGTAEWLLRNRDVNGLAAIIHFVGRTAYVSKSEFAAWFRSRPAQPSRSDAQRISARSNVAIARAAKSRRRQRGA